MVMKNIGLNIKKPKGKCEDSNCPFHGNLKCRGRTFTGTVLSEKMQKSVTVEWKWQNYIRKYERYEKRRSKVKAHNPTCINAKQGDVVKVMECRPLSKTKNFVIVEVLGKEKGFEQRMEAEEESKVKKETKVEESQQKEETEKVEK
jgi:small subunit ribosomal protein S17|tara:strand:+ start:1745 stop:2182 length:438 start_codon:yes stop_codon:yes gene_type:complete